MNRQLVQSSSIKSIGYDLVGMLLEVEFVSGAIYQYIGVPIVMYEGLMRAESKGKFLSENIKKGGFKYQRVFQNLNEKNEKQ